MDFSPLRPYTWALLLGLFVPASWILAIALGPGVVVFAVAGVAIVPLAWFLGLATEELGKHAGAGVPLEEMSLGIAGILLLAYVFGLFFSLRTHRDIFNPVTEVAEKPRWEQRFALSVLVVATVLVAIESEILVGSLEAARQSLGLTELFVGVIIVAIVGNAAEHGSAILMAWRNKMELSVAVATTSTTQVALFVAPILVFVSLLTAKVMTLDFEIFEIASLALATAVVAAVVSDGRSNWYEGALLVMVYAVIAVAFFFHPVPA